MNVFVAFPFILFTDYSSSFIIAVLNNLTGTIPPEWGYISDFGIVDIQSQGPGLRGSIPDTIGNMKHLASFTILFGGKNNKCSSSLMRSELHGSSNH